MNGGCRFEVTAVRAQKKFFLVNLRSLASILSKCYERGFKTLKSAKQFNALAVFIRKCVHWKIYVNCNVLNYSCHSRLHSKLLSKQMKNQKSIVEERAHFWRYVTISFWKSGFLFWLCDFVKPKHWQCMSMPKNDNRSRFKCQLRCGWFSISISWSKRLR